MSPTWSALVKGSRSLTVRLWGLSGVILVVLLPACGAAATGVIAVRTAVTLTAVLTIPVQLASMVAALRFLGFRERASLEAVRPSLAHIDIFFKQLGLDTGERQALVAETPGRGAARRVTHRPASLNGQLLAAAAEIFRDRSLRRAAAAGATVATGRPLAAPSAELELDGRVRRTAPLRSEPMTALEPEIVALIHSLAVMPAEARTCLLLRYGGGFSESEIADLTLTSPRQVTDLLADALRHVPRELVPPDPFRKESSI